VKGSVGWLYPHGGAENAGVENAGVESAGADCRDGKCRTHKDVLQRFDSHAYT